ncbi:hypothetical protein [Pseudomonas sp. PLMAX]|uniref:hypothetical protein n=1 Tax=Pseudomonas sp. PLMAX TaxID=2201998 RepID=UPI0038BD0966
MRLKPLTVAVFLAGIGASGFSLASPTDSICSGYFYPTIYPEPVGTWNGFELLSLKENPDSSAQKMEFRVGTACFSTRSGSRFSFEYSTEKNDLGIRRFSVEITPELRPVGDVAIKVETFMTDTQPPKSALISSTTHYLAQGTKGLFELPVTRFGQFGQMAETERKITFSATPIRNAD